MVKISFLFVLAFLAIADSTTKSKKKGINLAILSNFRRCPGTIENLNQNNARVESSMAEMAVQGLLEFWPCKSVNNPNFGLPIDLHNGKSCLKGSAIFFF